MTEQQIKKLLEEIENMSRIEMCRKWRFEPVGSPYLTGDVGVRFRERLSELGGFSPEISKEIGWGND